MEQLEDITKTYPIKNLGDLLPNSQKVAIIESSSKAITYDSLEVRAQSIATFLSRRPKSNIGIIASNSINFVIVYLGILKAGHTAVLISTKFPSSTIDYILKDSNISLVFSDTEINSAENILLSDIISIIKSFDFNAQNKRSI